MTSLPIPNEVATAPRRTWTGATWSAVGVTGLLFAVCAVSFSRSFFDPLGDDQALYQYITDRVIAGQRMYVDVWDQNLPGIVGVHWISTHLFGRSPMAFRLFDALWQVLTLVALAGLGFRASGKLTAGAVAALLYAITYYGYGYMQTGQREGFAVLPLMLAAHLVACRSDRTGSRFLSNGPMYFAAGVLAFFAFFIKSPLGLCYGALWCWSLSQLLCRPRIGASAAVRDFMGLTGGFLVAMIGAAALLWHLGWWPEFWRVLTRADMRQYVGSPSLIRGVLPEILIGLTLIILVGTVGLFGRNNKFPQSVLDGLSYLTSSVIACVLLFMTYRWELWRNYIVLPAIGIILPAVGVVLSTSWCERTRAWRFVLLLAASSWTALIIQGRFSPYQAMPFLAFASILAAVEIVERWPDLFAESRASRAWIIFCLAAVMQTGICHWWWTMTTFTEEPYVLARRSLDEHYDRVTKHKVKYPRYATTAQVAHRVRGLTAESDPIISLFHDPRIYYYCQRPPVSRIFLALPEFQHRFSETVSLIHDRRPKVLLARIPRSLVGSSDRQALEAAIWAGIEDFCGPSAQMMRDDYRLTEVIDEVCILQPVHR